LNSSDYKITVGAHYRNNASSWTLSNLAVSLVIMHIGYNNVTLRNDIALLKLQVYFLYQIERKKIYFKILLEESNTSR